MKPGKREKVVLYLNQRIFSPLAGITVGNWLSLLRQNRFAVDPPFWPRAAFLTCCSLFNTLSRWVEDLYYGRAVSAAAIQPPLFIIGHWRSGTTHLHNLLAIDKQFAYPNLYQAFQPHTFLCTEAVCSKVVGLLLPKKRLMDEVPLGLEVPKEDEFALCVASLCSQQLDLVFPRREPHYERYLTFRGVPDEEIVRWKRAFVYYMKKLTWKYRRPVLLKSPHHTCRIKLLLEMFPGARFIHIHRNPYEVFQSLKKLHEKSILPFALQRPNGDHVDDGIIRRYQILYEAFFEERGLIPNDRIHEVGFEDLEKDPVGQIWRCYEKLNLPGFDNLQPALQRYVESLAQYKKNQFRELPPPLRSRIGQAWQRSFEEWGYPA